MFDFPTLFSSTRIPLVALRTSSFFVWSKALVLVSDFSQDGFYRTVFDNGTNPYQIIFASRFVVYNMRMTATSFAYRITP
jgi:hypothetical protein